MDTPTLHEDHWRWRQDNGGEGSGGAGWHENEDTAHVFTSAGLDVNVRLRFSLHVEVAISANTQPQLEYNRNSGGWNPVNAASSVARSSTSSNFTDGDDTTEHGVTFVGTGSFFTDNDGMDDTSGLAGSNNNDIPAQDYEACEFCFQIREADLTHGDTIEFRITDAGTPFTSYPGTHATATISLAQTLTQSSRFDNTTSYGSHTILQDQNLTQTARFDNTTSYGSHTIKQSQTLTQSSRFDNPPVWGEHQLEPGAVTLVAPAYPSGWTVGAAFEHTITQEQFLEQTARFNNVTTWGSHTITQGGGEQTLTQTARFDNTTSYGSHTLVQEQFLTQTARFDNTTSYGSHTIAQEHFLEQTARFNNVTTWGSHTLIQGGGEQTLTQTARFDNTTSYGSHTLTWEQFLTQTARTHFTAFPLSKVYPEGARIVLNLEQTTHPEFGSFGEHGIGNPLLATRASFETWFGSHTLLGGQRTVADETEFSVGSGRRHPVHIPMRPSGRGRPTVRGDHHVLRRQERLHRAHMGLPRSAPEGAVLIFSDGAWRVISTVGVPDGAVLTLVNGIPEWVGP